eukprot:819768-Rhodomonas_salina.2
MPLGESDARGEGHRESSPGPVSGEPSRELCPALVADANEEPADARHPHQTRPRQAGEEAHGVVLRQAPVRRNACAPDRGNTQSFASVQDPFLGPPSLR